MATIKLNSDKFLAAVEEVSSASNLLSSHNSTDISAEKCIGLKISDYIEMFSRITALVMEYSSLLQKDCLDMVESAGALIAADNALAGEW